MMKKRPFFQRLINNYRRWSIRNSDNAMDWIRLGYDYKKDYNYYEAIDAFAHAIRIDPGNVEAWENIGKINYEDLTDFEFGSRILRCAEVIEAYVQIVRLDPKNFNAWYGLQVAYRHLKRYNEAIEACQQVLSIKPETVNVWIDLGGIYFKLNRYQEAIETYLQATRINPANSTLWCDLGDAYGQLNRYEEAIESYYQAIRLYPDNLSAWAALWLIFMLSKRYDKAIECSRQILHIDPKFELAYRYLIEAYIKSGNQVAAKETIQELRCQDSVMADELLEIYQNRIGGIDD